MMRGGTVSVTANRERNAKTGSWDQAFNEYFPMKNEWEE